MIPPPRYKNIHENKFMDAFNLFPFSLAARCVRLPPHSPSSGLPAGVRTTPAGVREKMMHTKTAQVNPRFLHVFFGGGHSRFVCHAAVLLPCEALCPPGATWGAIQRGKLPGNVLGCTRRAWAAVGPPGALFTLEGVKERAGARKPPLLCCGIWWGDIPTSPNPLPGATAARSVLKSHQ